jgi:rod shape-determining protein MreD
MLFAKIALSIILAVVFQGVVPRFVPAFSYIDLTLLVTVYFALMRDPALGMVVGWTAGLAGDFAPAMGHVAGVGGFSKTIIGYVVASVGVRVPLQGPFTRVLVIGLAALSNSLLFVGLHTVLDQETIVMMPLGEIARKVGMETAANLVAGVFIFWIMDKLFPENAPQGQLRVRPRIYD